MYIYDYYWVGIGERVVVPKGKKDTDTGFVVGWFVAKVSEMNRSDYLEVIRPLPRNEVQELVNVLIAVEENQVMANLKRATEKEKNMRSCYLYEFDFLKKGERWVFK